MSTPDLAVDADVASDSRASTAAARPRRLGRILGWVFVIALLLGVTALASRFAVSSPSYVGALHPESPGPHGARALAELVRQQGTQVEVETSRFAAADALEPGDTLVLTDPINLSDEATLELITSADRVVLLSSSSRVLKLLDLGSGAGTGGTVDAQCDAVQFRDVGEIDAVRTFTPANGVDGCFVDDHGQAAVLLGEYEGTQVSLVEARRLLSNQSLAENGNAALGLALLAQTDRAVWYVPSFQDSDYTSDGPASIGDLTPEWVTPAIILVALAGLAAIWWRGRRFGPLVAESLPVMVRAAETMHGRARLTAKAADAPHAAEAIRRGTCTRLAARLALSPRATTQEIADAASDRLQIPRGSLYDLLGGPAPETDRDLIDLARRLAELETAVDTTAHTERNRP